MIITKKTWDNYAKTLHNISEKAYDELYDYIEKIGGYENHENEAIVYAYGLCTKYGEAGSELACELYDEVMEASDAPVPPAVPANTVSINELSAIMKYQSDMVIPQIASRIVKRTSADTIIYNAMRDGCEVAWIPNGDTCPFCLMLASRGWQHASKKLLRKGHAEHIHPNCDCQYAVRYDGSTEVDGYTPEKYNEMYKSYDGDINAWRRDQYAKNKDSINEHRRIKYANRNKNTGNLDEFGEKYNKLKTSKLSISKELSEKRKTLLSTKDASEKQKIRKEMDELLKKQEAINKEYEELEKIILSNDNLYDELFLSKAREMLITKKVENIPVKLHNRSLSDKEIIKRLGGGDKTEGSCASLALAYIGNTEGYDVLDFRGGNSCDTIASNSVLRDIAKLKGVITREEGGYDDIKNALKLLSSIEEGKEYLLITGKHASMVRKYNGKVEYLELQHPTKNGWTSIDEYGSPSKTISKRFGSTKTRTSFGQKLTQNSYMIDPDSLKTNPEFKKILGYINTPEDRQKKGAGGGVK